MNQIIFEKTTSSGLGVFRNPEISPPSVRVIAAIGTPLDDQENLHREGLGRQLARLQAAGIDSILAAGTLGVMPLLTEDTYAALIENVVESMNGKGQLFIGASDLSLARTRQRIARLNDCDIEGVVILPPYFMNFEQSEIVAYFRALADCSKNPIYLYDLPQRTHAKIEQSTVLTLARHPNIKGIKCSDELPGTLELIKCMGAEGLDFRVIVAQPDELHRLIGSGVNEHLDGIFTLAPTWTMQIVKQWEDSSASNRHQANLTELRTVMRRHGGMSALTVLMNACGVPGSFAPKPFRTLSPSEREALLDEAIVKTFLQDESESNVPGQQL